MDADIVEWFKEPLDSGELRYERIAWLVKCNGGFQVGQWGFISYAGVWQQGLEQHDALELMQWASFLDGVAFSGVNVFDIFHPLFEQYVQRKEAEYEQPYS